MWYQKHIGRIHLEYKPLSADEVTRKIEYQSTLDVVALENIVAKRFNWIYEKTGIGEGDLENNFNNLENRKHWCVRVRWDGDMITCVRVRWVWVWLLISSDLIIIRCIDKEWWKYIYIMLKYIFTMSKVELWTQPLDVTSLSTFLLGVCGVWWWKYIYNMSKYIFIMSEMELCVQHFDVTSLSVFCWVGVGYYVCFLLHSF